VGRINNFSVSPDSKWVAFAKQDRTLRSHVYISPITGGEARHVSDDRVQYSENSAVWTPDGRYLVYIVAETASNGIATQGGIATTMPLWGAGGGALRRRLRQSPLIGTTLPAARGRCRCPEMD